MPSQRIRNTVMKAKCGHVVEKKYVDVHDGLCRKCHWYAMILTKLSGVNKQESSCLIGHLIEFYQRQLIIVPSKEKYIRKMLYMLNSLLTPFDVKNLR